MSDPPDRGEPVRAGGAATRAHPGWDEIRIGISACLVGERVRYDGGHKKDAFLTDILARHVTFVPVCPEVELGLGTPREPIRLQREGGLVRLVAPASGLDHTTAMLRYARARMAELERLDLSGYILKKDSPSCGMERVRVWNCGVPSRTGRGAFAAVLMERLPLLPVEEEGRLHDPALRENFIERVFAHRRVRALFARRWTIGELVAFHASEKLLVLAHDPAAYRTLGRLVARAKATPRGHVAVGYADGFLRALARAATRGRHANVLQHMAGYVKEIASDDERRELQECISDYRRGLLPLLVPITLMKHHVRRHRIEYLAGQSYLDPHPKELMLRNH